MIIRRIALPASNRLAAGKVIGLVEPADSEANMAKQGQRKQKLTKAQREARVAAAEERQRREEESKAKKQRFKQVFTIIVCVILVLALGIPTIGLSVLSAAGL